MNIEKRVPRAFKQYLDHTLQVFLYDSGNAGEAWLKVSHSIFLRLSGSDYDLTNDSSVGKHFINETDDLIVRLLRSLLVSNNSLRLIPEKKGKTDPASGQSNTYSAPNLTCSTYSFVSAAP